MSYRWQPFGSAHYSPIHTVRMITELNKERRRNEQQEEEKCEMAGKHTERMSSTTNVLINEVATDVIRTTHLAQELVFRKRPEETSLDERLVRPVGLGDPDQESESFTKVAGARISRL